MRMFGCCKGCSAVVNFVEQTVKPVSSQSRCSLLMVALVVKPLHLVFATLSREPKDCNQENIIRLPCVAKPLPDLPTYTRHTRLRTRQGLCWYHRLSFLRVEHQSICPSFCATRTVLCSSLANRVCSGERESCRRRDHFVKHGSDGRQLYVLSMVEGM